MHRRCIRKPEATIGPELPKKDPREQQADTKPWKPKQFPTVKSAEPVSNAA